MCALDFLGGDDARLLEGTGLRRIAPYICSLSKGLVQRMDMCCKVGHDGDTLKALTRLHVNCMDLLVERVGGACRVEAEE